MRFGNRKRKTNEVTDTVVLLAKGGKETRRHGDTETERDAETQRPRGTDLMSASKLVLLSLSESNPRD